MHDSFRFDMKIITILTECFKLNHKFIYILKHMVIIYLKLLEWCKVSGALFLTGAVFEYDIDPRPSVAVLWMLYKIRCNHMHPLCGAHVLPVLYLPVRGYTHIDILICTSR